MNPWCNCEPKRMKPAENYMVALLELHRLNRERPLQYEKRGESLRVEMDYLWFKLQQSEKDTARKFSNWLDEPWMKAEGPYCSDRGDKCCSCVHGGFRCCKCGG